MLVEKHEEHDVDMLYSFWRKYKTILLLLVFSIFTIVTTQSILSWRHERDIFNSSEHFHTILESEKTDDRSTMIRSTKILQEKYPKSSYAVLGTILMAKNYLKHEQYEHAQENIEWIINHCSIPELTQITRFKLAEIYYHVKQYVKSLHLLNDLDGFHMRFLVKELRGDILFELNRYDEALSEYQTLIQDPEIDSASKAIVTSKYNQLFLIQKKQNKKDQ